MADSSTGNAYKLAFQISPLFSPILIEPTTLVAESHSIGQSAIFKYAEAASARLKHNL